MIALVKVDVVAKRLGVSTKWVYAHAAAGKIPSVQINERSVRFDMEQIEKWIKDRESGS